MSTHVIPLTADNAGFRNTFVATFGADRLASVSADGAPAGAVLYNATPDLTAAEQATLADMLTAAGASVSISLADWQVIKAELPTLRTFMGATPPTNAQAVAAEKSIIRVLNAILRTS